LCVGPQRCGQKKGSYRSLLFWFFLRHNAQGYTRRMLVANMRSCLQDEAVQLRSLRRNEILTQRPNLFRLA
jgi:hypothetical protein